MIFLVPSACAADRGAQRLPMEKPAYASGVRAACTGAGSGTREEPRWKDYRVRFEAVGRYGQYLGNELLTVRNRGDATFVQVSCAGPWVLMQLPAGKYSATMHISGAPDKHIRFYVAENGRTDLIMRFPIKLAGAPTTKHVAANERQQTKL